MLCWNNLTFSFNSLYLQLFTGCSNRATPDMSQTSDPLALPFKRWNRIKMPNECHREQTRGCSISTRSNNMHHEGESLNNVKVFPCFSYSLQGFVHPRRLAGISEPSTVSTVSTPWLIKPFSFSMLPIFINAFQKKTTFLWIYEVSNVSPIPNKPWWFSPKNPGMSFLEKKLHWSNPPLGLDCQVVLQATPRPRCKGHRWVTWCPQVWCGYRTYHVWLMLLVNVGKSYHIGYIDAMDSTEYI